MPSLVYTITAAFLLCVAAPSFASDAAPVSIAEAAEQPIVQVVLVSGSVTSPRSAVLSTSVGGLIESMNVDAGDQVDAGGIVVGLDRELAALSLERAEAEEAQARTALEDARRRLAEAEEVGAQRAIAETVIKSLRAEVLRSEAALQAVVVAVREQQAIVRRHDVRAPFAGVVNQRIAEVGEWVNPGDGLVELVATEGLRFDFRVPQDYFTAIDEATQVQLRLDALPNLVFPGRIQAIVPVKDPSARTFLLRVLADTDSDFPVTPGMSARAALRFNTGRRGVVVDRDALLRYPDGRKSVWVAESNGGGTTVHEQRVEIGVEFDGLIEIESGLKAGAMVVTRGNEALQNGQAVSLR